MVAGRVEAADAAVGAEDLDTERETGRDVGVWLYTEHGVPPFYNSLIISNASFVKDNPEAVEAFLRGVYRSIDRALDDPDYAVEVTVENHPDVDADQFRAGWMEGIVPFADPWPDDEGQPRGYVNADLVRTYMDFLIEGGLIEGEVDPEDFIDLRFLPEALPASAGPTSVCSSSWQTRSPGDVNRTSRGRPNQSAEVFEQ